MRNVSLRFAALAIAAVMLAALAPSDAMAQGRGRRYYPAPQYQNYPDPYYGDPYYDPYRRRSNTKRNVLTVVGGTAGGAVVGGLLGGKKGAAIGAAVGAAGAGFVIMQRNRSRYDDYPRWGY